MFMTVVCVGLTACAPRFYQRHTVVLDSNEQDALQVRYGELDDCLFRHQIPVEYTVRRPQYTLYLRPVSSTDAQSARIEIRLVADAGVSLTVADVEQSPEALYAETGHRYLVNVAELKSEVLRLRLEERGERIGEERFAVKADHCRVLSPAG
jgi:hypothetical protein